MLCKDETVVSRYHSACPVICRTTLARNVRHSRMFIRTRSRASGCEHLAMLPPLHSSLKQMGFISVPVHCEDKNSIMLLAKIVKIRDKKTQNQHHAEIASIPRQPTRARRATASPKRPSIEGNPSTPNQPLPQSSQEKILHPNSKVSHFKLFSFAFQHAHVLCYYQPVLRQKRPKEHTP